MCSESVGDHLTDTRSQITPGGGRDSVMKLWQNRVIEEVAGGPRSSSSAAFVPTGWTCWWWDARFAITSRHRDAAWPTVPRFGCSGMRMVTTGVGRARVAASTRPSRRGRSPQGSRRTSAKSRQGSSRLTTHARTGMNRVRFGAAAAAMARTATAPALVVPVPA